MTHNSDKMMDLVERAQHCFDELRAEGCHIPPGLDPYEIITYWRKYFRDEQEVLNKLEQEK